MSPQEPSTFSPPTVQQRAGKPPGLLPRHTQAWVISGLAIAMVLIITFSGTQPSKPAPTILPAGIASADPNQARIEEYRRRIDEQAKQLAEERIRFEQARQEATGETGVPAAAEMPGVTRDFQPSPETSAVLQARQDIAADRVRREYEARFTSSLVVRRVAPPEPSTSPAAPVDAKTEGPTAPPAEAQPAVVSAAAIDSAPRYHVFEGTILETALTNRLDGAFAGPVKCLVTTNVYSRDRLQLLIPQGTQLLGEVRPVDSLGQQRLAMTFHRLIRPDGYSVDLEAPGLDQLGATGLRDKVNHHYAQIFGVSLAIGAIAGFAQANTAYGAAASTTDVYRQGVASSLSHSSLHVLDRFLNVLPSFTIREGARVKVFLMADLQLPAYVSSQIPLHRRVQ